MKNHIKTTTYARMRNAGYTAREALRTANTAQAWHEAESNQRVRLRSREECENYFDVYGEPEGYVNGNGHRVSAKQERDEIVSQIESWGCVAVVSEYWDGSAWILADSIGMCIYRNPLDPVQNCYVPDLMQSALNAWEAHHEE